MPTIRNGDATIYFEEHGQGFPILTFAPAGLQSTIRVWSGSSAPIHPVTEWSSAYRVIVMDQRNAAGGRSHAPITAADGSVQSLAGTSLLRFDEMGLVVEQRDAWAELDGRHDLPDWAA